MPLVLGTCQANMHGIVDLEPPVYSSVDAGSFAPFHQHGLTCLHSSPSPSTGPASVYAGSFAFSVVVGLSAVR